jgi:ubiquinone/menaquinone biosynthesis C-methylase UbiE
MNYVTFAEIYDKFSGNPKLYKDWLNYISKRTTEYNIKPKKILDLACGTGNLSVPLSRKYEVIGLDYSKEMLRVLKKKNSKIKTIHADMRRFKSPKVDLVISAYDSINYIITNKDLLKVFKNVYQTLNTSGIFIFDINSYDRIILNSKNPKNWWKFNHYYIFDEHINKGKLWTIKFHIFELKNKKYNLFEETHTERAYRITEIKNTLKKSGFKNIKVTNINFNKPEKNTLKKIFFTCQK